MFGGWPFVRATVYDRLPPKVRLATGGAVICMPPMLYGESRMKYTRVHENVVTAHSEKDAKLAQKLS
jgi:hypothetical protein